MNEKLNYIKQNNHNVPVIYEQNELLPIVSIHLAFRFSGSINDKDKNGLARLSARILGEGTKTLDATTFARELENRAISFSTTASMENFSISMNFLKEHLFYAKTALSELLQEPNLSDETLKKVKLLTQGSIANKQSDYDYIANNALNKMLFKNTPLENETIGTQKSIENISLDDITNFLKDAIDAKNAIFVIGGDISFEEASEFVGAILKIIPENELKKESFYETSDKCESKIITKPTEQAYIYFGSPLFLKINNEELYKARVASFILGESGFGSRLMEEIRVKKGLAYSVYSSYITSLSSSCFKGHLQTKNESYEEAIQIVKNVVHEFVTNGASEDELEKAKKFLLGSEPLRNETLSKRLLRAYGEFYRGVKIGHHKKELKLIKSLDINSLNTFITQHKEIEKLTFAIVKNDD